MRWREFLEDFYYNVHIRDGRERWTVDWRTVKLSYFGDPDRPLGAGHFERHTWVGSLPMRRYEFDRESRVWRPMRVTS
jgi:hypothetical protein